jgi:hypothetical protein
VEQAKVGIVEKFGKYERIAEPGFQCVNWICGRRLAGYISLRVQQLDVRCETKTKVSYNVHAVQHYVLVFVLHAYDLLQLCGLLSLRRGAFFFGLSCFRSLAFLSFSVLSMMHLRENPFFCVVHLYLGSMNSSRKKGRKKRTAQKLSMIRAGF